MKVLITGKNGQVGWALQHQFADVGDVIMLDRVEMDLARPDMIRAKIRQVEPDLIINPAAYTAVDKAESEPGIAMVVNGVAPGLMAEEAKKRAIPFIHYSTDYVYSGDKDTPWEETDPTGPLSVYGKTKLAGDEAVEAVGGDYLIFRTSWVYGARGKNFYMTMKRLLAERDQLAVVNDQFGTPTWCCTIAEITAQVVDRIKKEGIGGRSGVYHLASRGQTTWHGFATEIAKGLGVVGKDIQPISTDEYPLPARRPAFSVLSCEKLEKTFGVVLPQWQGALEHCIHEEVNRFSILG